MSDDLDPDTHGAPDTSASASGSDAPPPVGKERVGVLDSGKLQLRSLIKEAADYKALKKTPYRLRPVIIFTIIGAVVSIDSQIFGLARPEIIRDLRIDILPFFQAFSLLSGILIFAVLGVSYYADRHKRLPLVAGGVILSGIAAMFSAGAHSLFSLGASRMTDAVGGTALNVPIGSLQADYYPPEVRGKAFALQGVTSRVLGLMSPLLVAGLITATSLSWRLPYLISGPLLIVTGIASYFFLKEPVRGYMERRSLGVSEEVAMTPEPPPSFGEAWRTIWAIRTLRRLFIADIPGSAGDFIFSFFFGLLLFTNYNLSITQRALLFTFLGVVTLPFGFLSGGLIDVLLRRRPQRVLLFSGILSLVGAFAVLLISSAPPFWLLTLIFVIFGSASALLGPARGVLFVQILPAHVRTVGLNVRILAQLPGTILRVFIVGEFVRRGGIQGGLLAAVPFFIVSALIEISAAGLFPRDVKSALASQLASEEWRRAKEGGQGKLLVCRHVDVEYDGVQVLFGVDFDVDEGQIIALLGTNGAGKSTLLRAISGTQEASGGAIVFDGYDMTHVPPHEITQRGVIHMPGGRGVFPGLTVADNLRLGNWRNDEADGGAARIQEVYRLFPILLERAGERAGLLSGGEQQMVSLAQAFLGRPKLLMIDELSLGLSPAVVAQLIEIVRQIHAQGTTIIIVEQSVNVALTLAERAIFMEKGEVKFIGDTADLLLRPDILRAVYVKGTGALTEGTPAGALRSERERRSMELVEARPILEVKSLTKSFGGIHAVSDVSFDLREGESLGLIGPNGAGKTTAFDLICGFQTPDSGQIFLDGTDITELGPDERAKLRLVRRFQDARLFPSLSVFENILVALERKLEVRSMALNALQVPQVRQSERRARLRAERLIELLELQAYRDKFVKELSTGLRRITDLACVLATEPKVLLLDEPSSGIAQAESEGLGPLLQRVRFETGCSMLIIEHDMPLISAVSDELIAMVQGKILLRGSPTEVLNDERVIEAYLGTSEAAIQRSGALT